MPAIAGLLKLGQTSGGPPFKLIDLHIDHLGSTRVTTDEQGGVLTQHDFFPFGEGIVPMLDDSTKLFTGHERDRETGLDYMMARYYGSSLFRFLRTDPVATVDKNLRNPQRWSNRFRPFHRRWPGPDRGRREPLQRPRPAPWESTQVSKRPMFNPQPLSDEWSRWIVGEWEGSGESDTGQGKGVERIDFGLHGQFLICRGEAMITEITPEHANYLRKNMHASDEEIERFKRTGYQSLQLFTVDQTTGEVVGYLFDSLRCVAQGRGRREGNREIMEWEWATGHRSTRITERVSADIMRVIQRTPMPDGSVMEEKGESVRRKQPPVSERK